MEQFSGDPGILYLYQSGWSIPRTPGDEESRHINIYSIFSSGSEKASVSKMRNVVKGKKG